ncbi:secretion protein HlyD [Azorhizobium oxalatiphilum]|uniref:Secretion protein HlyD n=1 Tax=Azorhizobium oxalatiphilum TaxID=980631 RepID=A0A917FGP9_9HYPH|nr:HlyD family efflux transporter periplasmic adaptor subunit [Azorhizobium oxalatiphilum]GGF81111.1 secretion protein HlyD [Azorhizobium oxalatiphilum]
MRIRLRVLPLALSLAAALALAGCGESTPRTFSGYVEGDLLYIGPQEAGRVTRLDVKEGTRVPAGSVLALLEDDVQKADLAAAQASLAEAQARLDKAKAAVQRPEDIAVLQAGERRAAAALDLSRIELDRQKALAPRGASSQANLDSAQHTYDQNQASLDEVRRQIDAGRIASREEDIAAAQASVRSATANADAAAIRLARRTLLTPQDGQVQTLYYRVGELVPEGRPVVSVLPPGLVKVRFFVPEAQLPQMKPGQSVTVACDGCQPITADISFISDSAEYTPPVIYSREERAKLVYLVEARPRDPALARPGQPVTVSLGAAPPDARP